MQSNTENRKYSKNEYEVDQLIKSKWESLSDKVRKEWSQHYAGKTYLPENHSVSN